MPKKGTSANSTELALHLLTMLSENEFIGVRESARGLSVSPSTALRMLRTLADHDFAYYSEETKTYGIGTNFVKVAAQVYHGFSLSRVARPILENLFIQANETVNLGILTKDLTQVIHIDKVVTNRVVRIDTGIGHEAPSYCTGLGKAMLAFEPISAVRDMLNHIDLRAQTDRTITDIDAILNELNKVKGRGYADDLEEFAEHLECIAAPIFNHTGKVVAALSISRLSLHNQNFDETICNQLINATKEISAQLGTHPNVRL